MLLLLLLPFPLVRSFRFADVAVQQPALQSACVWPTSDIRSGQPHLPPANNSGRSAATRLVTHLLSPCHVSSDPVLRRGQCVPQPLSVMQTRCQPRCQALRTAGPLSDSITRRHLPQGPRLSPVREASRSPRPIVPEMSRRRVGSVMRLCHARTQTARWTVWAGQ